MPGADRAPGTRSPSSARKGTGDPAHEVLDGVELYKYRPYAPGGSALGFVVEYVVLVPRRRRGWCSGPGAGGRSTSIQACNPPDIFWPLGPLAARCATAPGSSSTTTTCAPSCTSRGSPTGLAAAPRPASLLERMHLPHRRPRHLDQRAPTATSPSPRGGKRPERRHGRAHRARPGASCARGPSRSRRCGAAARYLVAYIGVMGPQDGVDIVVRAADDDRPRARAATTSRSRSWAAGDCYDELVALRDELGLQDYVELHRAGCRTRPSSSVLSTADLGLSPDPKNPLNDVSTMNKTLEYMAFGLPVVAFDLRETRVSAGDAAVYAEPNDVDCYARAIVDLLDDEPRRRSRWARSAAQRDRARARRGRTSARLRRGLRPTARRHRRHRGRPGHGPTTSRGWTADDVRSRGQLSSSATARSSSAR